jgi:hypothetical protein
MFDAKNAIAMNKYKICSKSMVMLKAKWRDDSNIDSGIALYTLDEDEVIQPAVTSNCCYCSCHW